MAIRSALSGYVINEEQDGFVTVDFDFDFINSEDHNDLTAWEFIDDETSDDVSESVEYAGSDAESSREYIAGEDDDDAFDCPPIIVKSGNFGFAGADMLAECLSEMIGGGDAESATESIIYPEDMTERTAGGCYEEEEEDLEEDDYDLDDELVPYYVNGKLGRERMRKLGKRSCAKSVKSKRLTYNYNKAGCLRGKHGLGLKHSLM